MKIKTKLFTGSEADLLEAAALIRAGETVVFPTETVYGIGADAQNPEAVKKIFRAKGRPSDNPLIVHISDKSQILKAAAEIPESAEVLIDRFMPGPITIILKKNPSIPNEVTGGLDTVGIRMPRNRIGSEFLRLCGCPVAAPSANLSGKPSPTRVEHCIDDMDGRTAGIIDGGPCEVGIESTIIDMTGPPVIYRPGRISRGEIEDALGREVSVAGALKEGEAPKSPGLKYRHYSPKAEVVILRGSARDMGRAASAAFSRGVPCGIIAFDEIIADLGPTDGIPCISLGSRSNPQSAASALFAALRRMDDLGLEVIFAPEIPDTDPWSGVKNRLYRAAAGKVTDSADVISGR